jgi:hypothetical protein
MNPSIAKLLMGKTEQEAANLLLQYKKSWRVIFRDGNQVANLIPDRDDNRYGLVVTDGKISRVLFG